jgi:hypothetical protein
MGARDALMASGFEVLGHSRALQTHWLRRIGAYAFDLVVVFLPVWIVLTVLGVGGVVFLSVVSGAAFVVYGTTAEALSGKTLGKYVLGLEVRSVHGPMTVRKAAARNAPKFFWYIFPLLDLLLALVGSGDPRQRFTDRAIGTTVVWREFRPTGNATPS